MDSSPGSTIGDVVLEGVGLSKRYGSVTALEGVDIEIRRGEVLAVVGDNGAGKSTLVKVMCGGAQPDSGHLLHRGEEVRFEGPFAARKRGIETVWQDLALAPAIDVTGNIFLGRELLRGPKWLPPMLRVLDQKLMARQAAERLEHLEIRTVPTVRGLNAMNLSGGQRQAVAVARAAAWATDVLFMDEPTAALGVKQSAAVLNLATRLAADGLGVLVITHALPQVMDVADRIVVLRHGRKVATLMREDATQERIVSLIVGFEQGDVEDENV
jgi:fructose transport system ATP-binding protein